MERVFDALRALPFVRDQVVHVERVAARIARRDVAIAKPLPRAVAAAARAACDMVPPPRQQEGGGDGAGDELRLYSPQALAINAARAGRHVALSTSTASGKSLAYNVAVACSLVEEGSSGEAGASGAAAAALPVPDESARAGPAPRAARVRRAARRRARRDARRRHAARATTRRPRT